jgi:hypothetical protein
VINRIKLAHQHLGLIRLAHLRQTHMLGTHVGSDINLLAELALYGKFHELPDRLFFRRMHKDSGSWKRGDKEHEAKRYHATGSSRAPMTRWPTHLSFLAAVGKAPLPLKTRAALSASLARRMLWDRGRLLRELVDYAGSLLR